MRVVFVTRKYPPYVGGMETFSRQFVTSFKDSVHLVRMPGKQWNLIWWIPWTCLRLLWIIQRGDVVVLGDGVLSIFAKWLGVVRKSTPVAVILHGLDVTYSKFGYQHYLKYSLRYAAKLICVSSYTESLVQDLMPEANTIVINHGLLESEQPSDIGNGLLHASARSTIASRYDIDNQTVIAITTGRLVKRKGVAHFIEHVLPELPDNITYLIIGDGPEKSNIEALISGSLERRVRMVGRVSDAEYIDLLLAADVQILPNIHVQNDVEGFGIVAVESQFYGVPVAASAIEGLLDAVVDSRGGFLVHSPSKTAWINAINKALSLDKAEVAQAAKQRYGWDKIHQEYLTVFHTLTNS